MPMTVELGDLQPIVDRLVETGRYSSRDAVLQQAVRLVEQREADRDALLAELQIGLDDLEAGRTLSVEGALAELETYRKARRASKAA